MSKIFCFVNSQPMPDWLNVVAISEDGDCLAGHVSSNASWAKHDIGVTSNWKHEHYKEKYPDGYEVIWVDNPREHKECWAAIEAWNASEVTQNEQTL
jgi:hypothetical protein